MDHIGCHCQKEQKEMIIRRRWVGKVSSFYSDSLKRSITAPMNHKILENKKRGVLCTSDWLRSTILSSNLTSSHLHVAKLNSIQFLIGDFFQKYAASPNQARFITCFLLFNLEVLWKMSICQIKNFAKSAKVDGELSSWCGRGKI